MFRRRASNTSVRIDCLGYLLVHNAGSVLSEMPTRRSRTGAYAGSGPNGIALAGPVLLNQLKVGCQDLEARQSLQLVWFRVQGLPVLHVRPELRKPRARLALPSDFP